MVPRNPQAPSVRFPTVVDPQYAVGVTEQNEYAEERKAIEAIISRAPDEATRAQLKAALEHNSHPVGSDDPEVAGLMSRIATIRSMRTERLRAQLSSAPPAGAKVHVRLGVVSALPDGEVARVLRLPGDEGIPTVVVRTDARGAEVYAALKSAASALDRFGASVGEAQTIGLRRARSAEASQPPDRLDERYASVLAQVMATAERDLPGVGRARWLDFMHARSTH